MTAAPARQPAMPQAARVREPITAPWARTPGDYARVFPGLGPQEAQALLESAGGLRAALDRVRRLGTAFLLAGTWGAGPEADLISALAVADDRYRAGTQPFGGGEGDAWERAALILHAEAARWAREHGPACGGALSLLQGNPDLRAVQRLRCWPLVCASDWLPEGSALHPDFESLGELGSLMAICALEPELPFFAPMLAEHWAFGAGREDSVFAMTASKPDSLRARARDAALKGARHVDRLLSPPGSAPVTAAWIRTAPPQLVPSTRELNLLLPAPMRAWLAGHGIPGLEP